MSNTSVSQTPGDFHFPLDDIELAVYAASFAEVGVMLTHTARDVSLSIERDATSGERNTITHDRGRGLMQWLDDALYGAVILWSLQGGRRVIGGAR